MVLYPSKYFALTEKVLWGKHWQDGLIMNSEI